MPKVSEFIEIPATITARGQTTVPAAIRKMLALGKRDRVVFRGLSDGTVQIARQEASANDDPVLARFLSFLAKEMAASPSAIQAVPADLARRAAELVEGVEVDLEAALPDDEA